MLSELSVAIAAAIAGGIWLGVRALRSRGSQTQQAANVAFVTDIEGNWEFFMAYVKLSDALTLVNPQCPDGTADIELKDGWDLVFGGDVCDKGGEIGGTIRVIRTLVRLKRRYPQNVTLLLGNRDLNKLRLTSEICPSQLALLEEVPGPYWVPENKRISPAQFLRKKIAKEAGIPEDDVSLQQLKEANTAANRMRWMLKDTMGADGEFERRAAELAFLHQYTPTEEQVVASFVDSVAPGGDLREYLLLGQLACVKGSSLYVHGGIVGAFKDGSTDCLGYVPGLAHRVEGVEAWVTALNQWCAAQLQEWIAQPLWVNPSQPATSARGGEAIIDYVVPNSEPSVIMSRHLTKSSAPAPLPSALAEALNSCGITRLVIGHTPHGNSPTVAKSGGPDGLGPCCEIVMADTSYSDMSAIDNRGLAVSEVQMLADGTAHVHGQLEDGSYIEYELGAGVGPSSEIIGLAEPPPAQATGSSDAAADGRFVKAWLPKSDSYLFCRVDGFDYIYDRVPREEAYQLVRVSPPPSEKESPSPLAWLYGSRGLMVLATLGIAAAVSVSFRQ